MASRTRATRWGWTPRAFYRRGDLSLRIPIAQKRCLGPFVRQNGSHDATAGRIQRLDQKGFHPDDGILFGGVDAFWFLSQRHRAHPKRHQATGAGFKGYARQSPRSALRFGQAARPARYRAGTRSCDCGRQLVCNSWSGLLFKALRLIGERRVSSVVRGRTLYCTLFNCAQ